MEKNNMLKAVIFDLDGVITDSAKFHYLAWKSLADEFGISFDEEYNEKLKGVSRMDSLDLILQKGNIMLPLEEKEVLADRKNGLYKEYIKQITPKDVLPGIENFLQELKSEDIKMAIASASKNAFFIIKQLGMEDCFDYIVDAGKIERSKPFPDVFLAAAEAVGVLPKECIGVEDANSGIEAIKAAGMFAVGVGTESQMQNADIVLSTTAELSLAALRKYF